MTTENLILENLIYDETYARKTLPYIKPEYFSDANERIVFEQVRSYVNKYNGLPTKEALIIEIDSQDNISDKQYSDVKHRISALVQEEKPNTQWLSDTTEKWCQEKALYNAIMDSIGIIDGKSDKDKGAIPEILSDALSVSFDPNVGHDFLENAEERYEFYHKKEERIPFDLDYLNTITKGGLPKKTLNIVLAGTGVGKSLFMCHCAANNLMSGKNVLYITMEMAEEMISQRIDTNLLNVDVDNLLELPRPIYEKKIARVKNKTSGKLIVKEYPTASAHVGHFRHLLNELKLKKGFMPDVIYIDYLNICSSSRVKAGGSVNSYTLVKAIAEEMRGLAVEFNLPIISATQTTRSGFSNSDVDLTDTSESFGLPATADFMIALISTEELQDLNQIMIKQLKNRYGDPSTNKRFVIGVDRSKMKLFDVEDSAQQGIVDSGPVFDKSEYDSRSSENDMMKWSTKKFGKRDFSAINV
jgi:replicative DNA helicase